MNRLLRRCLSSAATADLSDLSITGIVLALAPTVSAGRFAIRCRIVEAIAAADSLPVGTLSISATMRSAALAWSRSSPHLNVNIHLLPHSSPYSSSSIARNASSRSGGMADGDGNAASSSSMMGVESCIAVPSGLTRTGTSGSF